MIVVSAAPRQSRFRAGFRCGHDLKKFAAEFAERREKRVSALELQIELRGRGRFAARPQLFAFRTGYRSTTPGSAA